MIIQNLILDKINPNSALVFLAHIKLIKISEAVYKL